MNKTYDDPKYTPEKLYRMIADTVFLETQILRMYVSFVRQSIHDGKDESWATGEFINVMIEVIHDAIKDLSLINGSGTDKEIESLGTNYAMWLRELTRIDKMEPTEKI